MEIKAGAGESCDGEAFPFVDADLGGWICPSRRDRLADRGVGMSFDVLVIRAGEADDPAMLFAVPYLVTVRPRLNMGTTAAEFHK